MVHGMWCGPWCWEDYRGFFGSRYEIAAPTLRHHDIDPGDPPPERIGTCSLLDYAADLEGEIRKLKKKRKDAALKIWVRAKKALKDWRKKCSGGRPVDGRKRRAGTMRAADGKAPRRAGQRGISFWPDLVIVGREIGGETHKIMPVPLFPTERRSGCSLRSFGCSCALLPAFRSLGHSIKVQRFPA